MKSVRLHDSYVSNYIFFIKPSLVTELPSTRRPLAENKLKFVVFLKVQWEMLRCSFGQSFAFWKTFGSVYRLDDRSSVLSRIRSKLAIHNFFLSVIFSIGHPRLWEAFQVSGTVESSFLNRSFWIKAFSRFSSPWTRSTMLFSQKWRLWSGMLDDFRKSEVKWKKWFSGVINNSRKLCLTDNDLYAQRFLPFVEIILPPSWYFST